jgi:SAM-dependent methyltransferase
MIVRQSIELPAPVTEVFRFVTCTENYPRFIPGYEPGPVLTGAEGQPGMTFRWHTRLFGWRCTAEETIVERQEGGRIRYRGRMMGVPFESSMETTPAGAGTALEITIRFALPWRAATRPLERAALPLVERAMASSIASLRAIFTGGGAQELASVGETYAIWGRHPLLYAAQDWITFAGRPGTVRRQAVAALGLSPGARVLEVACGTGRNFRFIEKVIGPAGSLVAFDYSPEMLEAARALALRRGWRNIAFAQGDAAVLEIDGGPVDGVLCVLGMSAIPDHRRALERCRGILRHGGALVVCDARLPSGLLSAANPLIRRVYGRWASWHPERDLLTDLRRIFGEVSVEQLNLGTFFIARAVKRTEP